ncbi:hypothetical protein NQD34_001381 [Periophthalmus magnuspinnatus]|nr:hypothetical protein NQD34_001381 [Periophthalmus magnuspinnatus]
MVCEKLPSPLEVSAERVERLMSVGARRFDSLPERTQRLKEVFLRCSSEVDAPVIVFVSKMFAVDSKALPQNRQRPLTQEEIAQRRELARQRHAERVKAEAGPPDDHTSATDTDVESKMAALEVKEQREQKEQNTEEEQEEREKFVAFARVYSGVLRPGQRVYVLGPKYDPAQGLSALPEGCDSQSDSIPDTPHLSLCTLGGLYLLMGRELEELEEVPSGNVLGIGGLEEFVLKSATLSTSPACPPFTPLNFEATPIVRVAIEPRHPSTDPQTESFCFNLSVNDALWNFSASFLLFLTATLLLRWKIAHYGFKFVCLHGYKPVHSLQKM